MSSKVKACPGKESFERINFLYQAASIMAGKNNILSCYYGNLLKSIGKKSVLRIHPEIKRTLCKRCELVLKPHITSDINIVKINEKEMCEIKCLKCNYITRYKINPKYSLWIEEHQSQQSQSKSQ